MKFLLLCFLGGGSQLWIFTKKNFLVKFMLFFVHKRMKDFLYINKQL